MFDFHEKRKIRSWIFSKSAIFLLFVASFFLAAGVHERFQRERDTAHKRDESAAVLADLQAHAAQLQEQVEYIQSARGIEAEIRDRFDAVKPGEQAVIVMDGLPAIGSTTSPKNPEPEEEEGGASFLSRLLFWR